MSRDSWGVVATVDEPVGLILAMVAHHLEQGASEIFLFLDRPAPELVAALADVPQVRITLCDRKYWRNSRLGHRPEAQTDRQNVNAQVAYAQAQVTWLLHCDADELVSDGAALARELAGVDSDVDCLRIAVAERVFLRGRRMEGMFGGGFRRPRQRFRFLGKYLYGATAKYLNRGVTGHIIGKTFSRTGRNLVVQVHGAHADGAGVIWHTLRRTWLLHFDAVTPLHWQVKLLRRSLSLPQVGAKSKNAQSRLRLIRRVHELREDQQALDALSRAVLSVSPFTFLLLRLSGMTVAARVSPEQAVARLIPAAPPVTEAAFDAALIESHGETLRQAGFVARAADGSGVAFR